MSFTNITQFIDLLQKVKPRPNGYYQALCPAHDDHDQSLSVWQKDGWIKLKCFAGCQEAAILNALRLESRDLRLHDGSNPKTTKAPKTPMAPRAETNVIYPYVGADGKLIFEVVRTKPKGFFQRRPDGQGGYITNLEGITPVLYHLDEIIRAIPAGDPIVIPEGEKDVDNLRRIGVVSTCNPMGAGKWCAAYSDTLKGADIMFIPDADDAGRNHALQAAASCYGKATRVRILELPDGFKDITDWLQSGHTYTDFGNLIPLAKEYKPTQLDTILERCKHWLYMPDTGPIEVVLGAVAANKLPGDPVWLLQVGTPGSGKTEVLNTIINVIDIYQVAILTEASLLSGTPRRDAPDAKGGLLKQMGEFGILQIKDFGSVLSLNRDSRGPILAALREIYDGSWTRYVGSEGGRTLSWKGKCGLIGGATPSIDGFYAVMAILGERFAYYRLPTTSDTNKAQKALTHAGHEAEMRYELSSLVADFFNRLDMSKPVELTEAENDKLTNLAVFSARCRSPVERDVYASREIQLIPGVEAPTRLVKVLSQLLRGLQTIGIPKARAWELVQKTGLDSMPALRQNVLLAMLAPDAVDEFITSGLAMQLGYPTNTTRRTLEDMACYGIVERDKGGKNNADLWSVSRWTRETYKAATVGLPEIREGTYTPTITVSNQIQSNININILNNKKRISGKPTGGEGGNTGNLQELPQGYPPYPATPCRCGSNEFWPGPVDWLCCTCHPQPKEN